MGTERSVPAYGHLIGGGGRRLCDRPIGRPFFISCFISFLLVRLTHLSIPRPHSPLTLLPSSGVPDPAGGAHGGARVGRHDTCAAVVSRGGGFKER